MNLPNNLLSIAQTALSVASFGLALIAVPMLAYLGVLTLLSRRRAAPTAPAELPTFVVVVPAHNEAAQIAETVRSLQAMHYPQERYKIWVVADNCSDKTADFARDAGATVLERQHATERGKGYALNFAFEKILASHACDAVVVVDADTVVSANLLQAFAARLHLGALAAQADYGVRNPFASWRTRLMVVALAMFHRVRSLGRETLRVSCGLRGNGMCFSLPCLQKFPHKAVGLVEDVEYGIALGEGGVRVVYVDEAQVLGEMVSTGDASASQRERWEGGRRQLIKEALGPLLRAAWRKKSGILLDLAIDLRVPPLGQLGVLLMLGTASEIARLSVHAPIGLTSWAWGIGWASLLLYLLRGMQLSGLGFAAVTTLACAPLYIVWKLLLRLRPRNKDGAWVRTEREQPKAVASIASKESTQDRTAP